MRGARWAIVVVGLAIAVGAVGCTTNKTTTGRGGTSPDSAVAPLPDGLAFIKDGAALVVRGGKPVEVLPGDKQQSAVVYDAEGEGLLVTENSGISRRTVRLVKGARTETLLETDDGSNFGDVRFASALRKGFYIINGQPGASFHRLAPAPGWRATGEMPVRLPKSAALGFDLAADGSTLVYATDTAEPTQLLVLDGLRARFSIAQLAYAFTPSFSRDATKVCLTGIKSAGDPVTIWTLDVGSRTLTEVPGTAQYRPTNPVFSPDGTRIAFRNADDGSVWIVPASGGTAEKLPLTVDDAALDW